MSVGWWDLEHPIEFYNPGRAIGGRACPKTAQLDGGTLGTIFQTLRNRAKITC